MVGTVCVLLTNGIWVLFPQVIQRAFDHLNQAVVLDKLQTFPALRQAIKAWLTAGVIDGNTYMASEMGIAQGGLCKALHKPPYAKWKTMQSKCRKGLKLLDFSPISFA